MKFKSLSEFRTYLEDELLSNKVIIQHLSIVEDPIKMTDLHTDKTNQNWDWMKDDTLYLIRSASQGYMAYLYAPVYDNRPSLRKIYYAHAQKHKFRTDSQYDSLPPPFHQSLFKFYDMNVGDWDAADEDATWVRGIFEVDSYDRLLMNWNNSPWEDLK